MELLLEILMGVLLDAAMLLLVLHLMKSTNAERKQYCFLSRNIHPPAFCAALPQAIWPAAAISC